VYSEKTEEIVMSIIKGYDGSCHAPTAKVASKVKKRGHVKEHEFAERIGGNVTKGVLKKPDVIKDEYRYSMKGAEKNIQLFLLSFGKSENLYGSNNPMYKYQLAAYNHKKFKFENNNMIDEELFNKFKIAAKITAEWLQNKDNFRFVLEKVLSDDYDANKLVILKDIDQDALVYDMREVVDLWVNSNYKVHVTDGAKIVVTCQGYGEIFYLETRGSSGKIGSMNHGCRAPQFYSFLKENLTYEVISK
jgi:hypothetical protein